MKQRQMDMSIILDTQAPSQIPNPDSSSQYNFLGKLSSVFLGCDPEWAAAMERGVVEGPELDEHADKVE